MPPKPLEGRSILVLEDDYFQAEDARQLLRDAGAEVRGPFGDAAAAIADADASRPDCAILDINLGRGANFAPIQALLGRGVPVLIVTGYDDEVIPPELHAVPRLRKPTNRQIMLRTLEGLCAGARVANPNEA